MKKLENLQDKDTPGQLDHQVGSYLASIMDEEWVFLW